MTEVLFDHAPRVRCYECGDEQIFSLCHHCQRPMCERHSPFAFRQGGLLVRSPAGAAEQAQPASREFAGLRLGALREAVYHCKDHDHVVRGMPVRWIIAGAATAALGFLLLFASAAVGVPLLLIGAATAGVPILVHRMSVANAVRPPLPLVPQVNTVDVVERLTGYVRLENDEYTSTVTSVGGRMTVGMSANEGHLMLQAYRKRFALAASEQVPFAGGFLMLEGAAGLAFRAGQKQVLVGGTGISLGGESTDGHAFFPVDPEMGQRAHTLALDYELQDDRSPHEVPLWIVPSLVPGSNRQTLAIDLHWNHLGPDERPLKLSMFDLIELQVPASWGNVEGSDPKQPETGRTAERRTIKWKQLKPKRKGDSSRTLTLQFERPITEILEPAASAPGDVAWPDDDAGRTRLTLTGTLQATFEGLLSGVTGTRVYLPGGGEGHRPQATTNTKVTVTFDVSLRSIRYQDERVVPDENRPHDGTRADEFHGVVPDYVTVAELTKAISLDNYYVKSVVEHPPYRDDARSGVLNRVWDVAGRRYIGLFPIDFDISLRGEEADASAGFSGKTVAQVTVKGTYATGALVDQRSPADADDAGTDLPDAGVEIATESELLTKIEDTWSGLHARVTQILGARANRPIAALPPVAEGVLHGEVLDPPDLTAPDFEDVVEGVTVTADQSRSRHVAELYRQRTAADEAVVMGRISEETHRGIVTRIEAALSSLEGTS